MGGVKRHIYGIKIICDNIYTPETYIAESTREAKEITGVSIGQINVLIKNGHPSRRGWVFDETQGRDE